MTITCLWCGSKDHHVQVCRSWAKRSGKSPITDPQWDWLNQSPYLPDGSVRLRYAHNLRLMATNANAKCIQCQLHKHTIPPKAWFECECMARDIMRYGWNYLRQYRDQRLHAACLDPTCTICLGVELCARCNVCVSSQGATFKGKKYVCLTCSDPPAEPTLVKPAARQVPRREKRKDHEKVTGSGGRGSVSVALFGISGSMWSPLTESDEESLG
jgi:hypothetical protein